MEESSIKIALGDEVSLVWRSFDKQIYIVVGITDRSRFTKKQVVELVSASIYSKSMKIESGLNTITVAAENIILTTKQLRENKLHELGLA
jgi:hypothetical protein